MYCELCLVYHIFCVILYSVNVAQHLFKSSIARHILCSYIVCITCHTFFVLYCMSFVYCQHRRLCKYVLHCGCNSCVVFALLQVQCAVCVNPMLCLHYCQRSVLCVVFALLPAQYAVCVSPVLCLLNILQAQFAMRGLRQVLLILFYLLFFALLPAHCALCV